MNQKKKIGNVQVAETNTPSPESDKGSPGNVDSPVLPDTSKSTGETRLPIDLSAIDPAKIAMAEKFGIPIGQILSWMASVEERFNSIEKVLPQQIAKELQCAIEKAKSEQPRPVIEPPLPSPSPGGSSMAGLLSLLPTILQQQGGTNDLLAELSAKALKGQIAMSEAITNAVVSKIAARATDEVAGAVTG